MANVRSGNSWYIDTVGNLGADDTNTAKNVVYILLTSTSANAIAILRDRDSNQLKTELRLDTAGHTQHFKFEIAPISFPGGIKVDTLTNCNVTIVLKEGGT